jgi:hypothetical protein
MYAARAITRTLQLRTGAFVSRQSALLRQQSQSRGNAAAAVVNNGLNNNSRGSTLKSSSANDDNHNDGAPPDFVRLGIQRMLEQAQQNSNDNKYNGNNSNSTEIENSKALQALELVQVRAWMDTYNSRSIILFR